MNFLQAMKVANELLAAMRELTAELRAARYAKMVPPPQYATPERVDDGCESCLERRKVEADERVAAGTPQ